MYIITYENQRISRISFDKKQAAIDFIANESNKYLNENSNSKNLKNENNPFFWKISKI